MEGVFIYAFHHFYFHVFSFNGYNEIKKLRGNEKC